MNVLEFRGMRYQLHWFANEMERQLEKNDYKHGWSSCADNWLLNRLRQEMKELELALKKGKGVVEEAADVANFAMMIADNFQERKDQETEEI